MPGDGHNLVVLARLEATGMKTVSGYSSAYDDVFPTALDGISTWGRILDLGLLQ